MSKVAVLKTTPESVLDDYARLLALADVQAHLPRHRDCQLPIADCRLKSEIENRKSEIETALKINISWHRFYPACSTTPWQLEGVIRALIAAGYPAESLYGAHNRTVVVSARKGEVANKQKPILEKYGVRNVHLYEKGEEWARFEPKSHKFHVLHEIFPDGVKIPKRFIGSNIVHLPTMKTHVFTTMTGAMKNAFGGLLSERRHWTHSRIHETLADLLAIQKEIHAGIFAVMDGTFAGDGPGPRCMVPHTPGYILASADQVAIDAIAAKMMGFDPLGLDFIRIADEDGLGCGDPREIEVVGEDIAGVNFGFHANQNTFASRGQKLIYWGPLKFLEKLLLRTFLVPWSYVASILYHDFYWYPLIGRRRVRAALKTDWGQLFQQY